MKLTENKKKIRLIFILALVAAAVCFGAGLIKTYVYNSRIHVDTFSDQALFTKEEPKKNIVSVEAAARDGSWGKIFDFNNEGITENNYTAYIYDFTVKNETGDEVPEFSFKLTFCCDVYLNQAWNGAVEVHKLSGDKETVATVPDLRVFKPDEYPELSPVKVDGDSFIPMKASDYIVYKPSTAMNAMEMPIEPNEGTTPGFILYVANGDSIEGSSLELSYKFNRLLTSEPLLWIAIVAAAVWLVALIIYVITSLQIKKYKVRHERDNKIINESIETFIGFIDAKDPYTNGHSKRVAHYTRLLAKEFGFSGEDLDHIYYVALLHDCGKIGVPDNILGKPGKLTPEEFEIIKSHTVRGGDILQSFKSLENADEGARYHHERYDGNGYPEGKAGEDIPFIARLICVADSFDAMNSDRVYRKKLTRERIIEEIENNKGSQFDPKVADMMLELIKKNVIPTSRDDK